MSHPIQFLVKFLAPNEQLTLRADGYFLCVSLVVAREIVFDYPFVGEGRSSRLNATTLTRGIVSSPGKRKNGFSMALEMVGN